MIRFFTALVFLAVAGLVPQTPAWAYGGGGGGSGGSCTKPYFSNEQPAQNAEVKALSEVSFTATDNTATGTLAVKVNGQAVQLTVTPQSSGRFAVVGKLPQPVVQAGKVHISVYGKSKDDCDNQLVYFVTVKPVN